jgi:CBS domain-containing protein
VGLLRLGKMPPLVSPDATVTVAVQLMIAETVGALAVIDHDKLVGIFTERDLMKRVVARELDPKTTPVGEVMTTGVRTVPDETTVAQAINIMRTGHFRHLPVVDERGKLISMVALRFLLYDVMDELEAKVDNLEGYLMEDSGGG